MTEEREKDPAAVALGRKGGKVSKKGKRPDMKAGSPLRKKMSENARKRREEREKNTPVGGG